MLSHIKSVWAYFCDNSSKIIEIYVAILGLVLVFALPIAIFIDPTRAVVMALLLIALILSASLN